GIVERRFAHHRLREAGANVDLPEYRYEGRRVRRGERRPEEERHDRRNAQDVVRGEGAHCRGDSDADGRDREYRDTALPKDVEPHRRAAVEKNVAGAEEED